MTALIQKLEGKKTYIVSACGLIVVGLWVTHIIPTDVAGQLLTILGFGGAITLRSAVANLAPKSPSVSKKK